MIRSALRPEALDCRALIPPEALGNSSNNSYYISSNNSYSINSSNNSYSINSNNSYSINCNNSYSINSSNNSYWTTCKR